MIMDQETAMTSLEVRVESWMKEERRRNAGETASTG